MIIVIDNYDSFTYNLVQYLGELASEFPIAVPIEVYRNDKINLATIEQMRPDGIVISPGPGRPVDAGISLELIAKFGPICQFWGSVSVIKVSVKCSEGMWSGPRS